MTDPEFLRWLADDLVDFYFIDADHENVMRLRRIARHLERETIKKAEHDSSRPAGCLE